MIRFPKQLYVFILLVLFLIVPAVAEAADYATFESFYKQSWTSPWALAALVGVIVGVGIYLFAPPLGPVTTAVGTWLGGVFGYSGIAATNFGLALLGGGTVAAGGLGIAGGAAVVAAALTFSTDIVLDYAAFRVTEAYSYSKFATASKDMLTLPPPRNRSGPRAYKDAIAILRDIDRSQPLANNQNQSVVERALTTMDRDASTRQTGDLEDDARADTLRALLKFTLNDYVGSRRYALQAIQNAQKAKEIHTVPSFLLSVSMLYDETINFEEVKAHFTYAIHEELDNPMVPILFGILLDRLIWRINNDRSMPVTAIDNIADVAEVFDLDEQWIPTHAVLLSRYLLQLKAEQNRIASLSRSENSVIRDSDETLLQVRRAMTDYGALLEGAYYVAGRVFGSMTVRYDEAPDELMTLWDDLVSYSHDRARLEGLVQDLADYQAAMGNADLEPADADSVVEPSPSVVDLLIWLMFGIAGGTALGMWIGRRRPWT